MGEPIRKVDFDTSVRPQDDFYQYVNGGWCARNTIPKTERRWGTFEILHKETRQKLHTLLKNLTRARVKKGSDEQKLRDLYLSAMDIRTRNRLSIEPLHKGFEIIGGFQSRNDIPRVFGYLHTLEVGAPWQLWMDQDDMNSKRMVLRIGAGGLGVPERGYLLKSDRESKRVRNAYLRYIRNMLALRGVGAKGKVAHAARTILTMERRLARASMRPVERRDPHAMYNKYSLTKLQKAYPRIPWRAYFDALGVPEVARKHIIVDQPKFLAEVHAMLRDIPCEDWQTYLGWHFLDAYAGTLGQVFIEERFAYYGRALCGLQKLQERWKRAVGVCMSLMPDAIGKLYIKQHFPPKAKREIEKLVENLKKAYRQRIKELEWMSAPTKRRALQKLDAVDTQLGYPKKWRSYRKLAIEPNAYAQNVMRAVQFEFADEMKRLAKPTDRVHWDMPAPTVNAFYSPNLNRIMFPAGILQPPFFDPDADPALNYGGIGATIGHELTHGFDDEGSKFDGNGNLRNWWTKTDRTRFEARAKVLERQFNRFTITDGVHVNGKLTLGENIADLGGTIIAYDALQLALKDAPHKKRNGLTQEQRFFMSDAITWRALYRDEFLHLMVRSDPHAPSRFRIDGIYPNIDAFYDTFKVRPGDAMYVSPGKRARIW